MPKSKVRWKESASVTESGRTYLPELAQDFFRSGRKAARDGAPTAALHRFRLEVKAFRYTLEFFRPCYGPGLERRLEDLRKIQDCLGTMNDCATTWLLVADRLPKGAPGRLALQRRLQARAQRKAAEFRRFWRTVFDRTEEERLWLQYLRRPHPPGPDVSRNFCSDAGGARV